MIRSIVAEASPMTKPDPDPMQDLVERVRVDWFSRFDSRLLKVLDRLAAVEEELRTSQDAVNYLYELSQSALADIAEQRDGILQARKAAQGWGVQEWLPEGGEAPDPDDTADQYAHVSDVAQEALRLLASMGRPRTCANAECGKRFLAPPWGREKLYCCDYCRVKAHRANRRAESGNMAPEE
jgi:hypothetical protein